MPILIFTAGAYFYGKLTTGNYKIEFAPNPQFSFLGEFNQNYFTKVGIASTTMGVDLLIL